MAQQTAVEYFDEQIQEYVIAADHIARVLVIQISVEEYLDVKSKAKQMEKEQSLDLKLPSDEEIIKNAPNTPKNADDYLISNKIGFVQGAKWMKKEILNQNK